MSTLIIEVCAVEEIAPIPDADRIERIRVKNWWCVSGKGHYKVGDKAVYVPPDSLIPKDLAERWGISKYCSPVKENGVNVEGFRVRACRFRGMASFGTIQDPDDLSWPIGHDVKEHYGITKYETPMRSNEGDSASPLAVFHAYTSIENIGNFPNVFSENEEVIITEKIHGTNSRVGLAINGRDVEFMAGSHSVRRKEFNDSGVRSRYWLPFNLNPESCALRTLLNKIWLSQAANKSVIVFGEIFGAGIQDMTYGGNGVFFRVFDIAVDDIYLDYDVVKEYLKDTGIELVPLLYRGPFSIEKVSELVDGPTTVCDPSAIKSSFKGREGVVIKSAKERFDRNFGGRAILKAISVDYLSRRNGTEFH